MTIQERFPACVKISMDIERLPIGVNKLEFNRSILEALWTFVRAKQHMGVYCEDGHLFSILKPFEKDMAPNFHVYMLDHPSKNYAIAYNTGDPEYQNLKIIINLSR